MNSAPENVCYASLPKRLAAFAFDYLVIMGYLIILTVISAGLAYGIGSSQQITNILANPIASDILTFLTLMLPVILYFTIQESAATQATWGKRKMDINVISVKGGRLSKTRAFIRSFVKFLPWQLAHTSIYHIPGWPFTLHDLTLFPAAGLTLVWVLAGAYMLSPLISKTNRTPYDWLSGAYVVIAPSAKQKVS